MERLIEFKAKQEQDIEQLLKDLDELFGGPIALEDIEQLQDEDNTWYANTDAPLGLRENEKVWSDCYIEDIEQE